jgi:hypothetical protein
LVYAIGFASMTRLVDATLMKFFSKTELVAEMSGLKKQRDQLEEELGKVLSSFLFLPS